MTDYKPIPCARHSEYELWIMHRRVLELAWRDPQGNSHAGQCLPLDIYTRGGEEFLLVRTLDNLETPIRLDRIRQAQPVSPRNDRAGDRG